MQFTGQCPSNERVTVWQIAAIVDNPRHYYLCCVGIDAASEAFVMDRTPLKSIGNILPNCLTVSGQKKLIGPAQVSHLTQQLSKSDPSGAGVANGILKTQLPQTENSTGNRSRQNSESDRPGGSPGTPMKPSGQSGGSKPGQLD